MEKVIYDLIFEYCWSEFVSTVNEPDDLPRLSKLNRKTLSFIDGDEISWEEARTQLKCWLKEQWDKHGKVYLYVGRDNSEIGVEDPFTYMDDEDMDLFHRPWKNINFWIGYD